MRLPTKFTLNDLTSKSWSFDTLETFIDFVETERDFWQAKIKFQQENARYVHPYLNIYGQFQNVLSVLEDWKPNLASWDENSLNSQIISLQSHHLNAITGNWLWSGHPFISTWLESYKVSQSTGGAFIEFIVNKSVSNIQNHDWFIGYVLAYEYELEDESNLRKRRVSEEKSFSHLRKVLSDKKIQLVKDVTLFQEELNQWKDNTEVAFASWHKSQLKLSADSLSDQVDTFTNQMLEWTNKVSLLETTYQEKLRLDGPASYWNKKAKQFRQQGGLWGLTLVLSIAAGIAYFSIFFMAWLQGQPQALKLQSLEGVILFAAILSTFAFLIRSLSKLTFSAFHLQRDAEEREQLTHLYLSLANESEVDAESRRIVLQALFSRSETGLIQNENGPAMPGGFADAINIAKSAK